jgi:hypothetical protein|tara:strand:+ start:1662 stop:1976 length:315 start_codon:yes stop_codon:yes gene_type:complete
MIPNNETPGAYPGAMSRFDNRTEVCSMCGSVEALIGLMGCADAKKKIEVSRAFQDYDNPTSWGYWREAVLMTTPEVAKFHAQTRQASEDMIRFKEEHPDLLGKV